MSGLSRRRFRASRTLAALSLVSLAASLGLLVWFTVADLAAFAIAAVGLIAAAGASGYALTRHGVKRRLGIGAAILFLGGMILAIRAVEGRWGVFLGELALVLGFAVLYIVLARMAVRRTDKVRNVFVRQHRPERPVVIMNPRSGGGKVVSFNLPEEARRRGVEAILLEGGADLLELAEAAVRGGADCLGMAGGDGSQALVAEVATRYGLPFVCIPAGTRNHLALDLGIDRNDPRKAFDAFTEGFLSRIDLGEVGGRVFVNNVSLGVYAEIVQEDAYRDAKFSTATNLLPDLMTPEGTPADLRFSDPDGLEFESADALLVSNNPYQMRTLTGFGQRPRLDTGQLGVAVLNLESGLSIAAIVALAAAGNPHLHSGYREWTTERFRVTSSTSIKAGVDGEAMVFDSPLDFAIRPRALQVLLPPGATRSHSVEPGTIRNLLDLLSANSDES